MDYKFSLELKLFLFFICCWKIHSEERHPYQPIDKPCEICTCENFKGTSPKNHFILDCSLRNFTALLAKWPNQFGDIHKSSELRVKYSANKLKILQQLPSTNATVSFTCQHCQINEFDNSVFIDVPHIQSIDLSWNQITGEILTGETLRGPNLQNSYQPLDLERIDLSHNNISYLDSRLFEHCPKLIYLNLNHNTFEDLFRSITALKTISQLSELHLSNNKLQTFPKELFGSLRNLKKLYLPGNMFTTIPSASGIGATLQVLNVANNSLKELNELNFIGFERLKVLNASYNKNLTTIRKTTFLKLENLEELYLGYNVKLATLDLGSLMGLRKLAVIDISFCSLTTLTYNNSISNSWPKLRKINLEGNMWNCNCDLLTTFDLLNQNGTRSPIMFEDYERKKFVRCNSPHSVAGARLTNLSRSYICDELLKSNAISVMDIEDEVEPPKFLRPRNIALSIIVIAIVIILGIIVGFLIVTVKRKLTREDFGASPVRYSTVRNSTMSS